MGPTPRGARRRGGTHSRRLRRSLPLVVPLALAACLGVSTRAADVVRVGVYDNPPKVAIDETGEVSGLYPDLVEDIAQHEGWTIEYVAGTWTESMARLDRGEIDVMVDVARTPPRIPLYAFNEETVLVNWGTVYARASLEILSLPDLDGLRVAVMRGSTHTEDPGGILDLAERFGLDIVVVEHDSYQQVFRALSEGEADAGVVNRVFGIVHEANYAVARTPIVFNPIELRFALPLAGERTAGLIERIDHYLSTWKADPDSIYYAALEKHLLAAARPETIVRWPPWVLPALGSAAAIILVLVLAVLVVRREVRKRSAAEAAHRRAEERFALAMRGANDGLWDWDLATGRVYYSPRWAAMLGYEPDELEPSIDAFRRLVHPDDRERVVQAEELYMAGRADRYQAEFRMLHRDGLYIDVLSRAFLVRRESDDAPVRVVGTHVDISERKYAAAQLEEAKERAEEADRLKSAFLATMSHELRTPLNSIIGFTGILLQELAGPLNEEQRKQMTMVQTSARHLLALINDVLDISKIEAGQLEVHLELFDVAELIREVSEAARPLAEAKDLDLRVEIALSDGSIRSDRRRVGQILTNLLSNAVKFTEAGSVAVRCGVADGSIEISVQDTGIGIAESEIDKLFIPFQQIDSGLTRKYEGTGLGLSICRRLSEKLGGTIGVESRPDVGSTFTVRIPKGT